MDKTIKDILSSKDKYDTLKITYGNGETFKLKKSDEFQLTDDGWLIFDINHGIEHIKIDSIYRINLIQTEYVHAIIPSDKEISNQILEILSDNKNHKTRDIKKILVKNVVLSKEEGEKISKAKLNEKIDWISSFEISKLKKANLIESKKWGFLKITPTGLSAIQAIN